MLKVLSFFFIYFVYWWLMKQVLERFDAQCSELFLYWQIQIYNETEVNRRFRCSMFWVFSLWDSICNLSNGKTAGFDAQCFELFLYRNWKGDSFIHTRVSTLNVLSFFFILILQMKKTIFLVFRCSMFWAFSLWAYRVCERLWILWFRCSMFWAFSL